jgi:hypothetical protein
MRKRMIILTLAALTTASASFGQMMHNKMHGHTEHDEVTMPGLRGLNATPQESADLEMLFRHFQTLNREVTNLPNGIKTRTYSTDPVVMEALINHVTGMISRVEESDDPKIFIQSPTLDIFFDRHDAIATEIELTDDGIVVTQTSTDIELVNAMHLHAAEVTAMVDRGMQAVHEMMSERGQTH